MKQKGKFKDYENYLGETKLESQVNQLESKVDVL